MYVEVLLKESQKGGATMKGNVEKLAVFVIIAAIAMFMVVAMASADDHHAIRGQYAASGGGGCLIAPLGFDPKNPGVPNYDAQGAWIIQTFSNEGVWTFDRNGTGSVQSVVRFVTQAYTTPPPPIGVGPVPPSAGAQDITFSFHYTITDQAVITVTVDQGTYTGRWFYGPAPTTPYYADGLVLTGAVAPDGKTITLNRGLPNGDPNIMTFGANAFGFPPGVAQLICHQSTVLIWQQGL